MLLCDVDHGLVHEHGLVMSRRGGELVVRDADGRRIWGPADAAFAAGLGAPSVGPIRSARPLPDLGPLAPLLTDGAGGRLADSMDPTGERMDLGHVVWALLVHRDHLRRQAA